MYRMLTFVLMLCYLSVGVWTDPELQRDRQILRCAAVEILKGVEESQSRNN